MRENHLPGWTDRCDDRGVLAVRRAKPADAGDCVAIVRGLPEYFTEDVPDKVAADLLAHSTWLAVDGRTPVGFAIVERRFAHAAEILWFAITASRRGHGVGSWLLDRVLGELSEDGLRLIEVKTLDAGAGYEPYRATRAFWEKHGFLKIDTIDPLPDWSPGNPAAIYVASLPPALSG
ncbi:GNAT family N-acetyltransferase [Tamaricihabitans halophyticus]|uniref:GNAT family N-acetyltransferase n=1 Tax=Tamaricihabitans halophyticus TaxID=1262583 RepID=UPI0014050448|nr:GNAT family N-acetyltransferase [Tamaricihabitans halophyticus]